MRDAANAALEKIGSDPEDKVPALLKALKDEDANVRVFAARALGAMGQDADNAVYALIETVKEDENAEVRRRSAEALGNIGRRAKPAIHTLRNALRDPSSAVRDAASRQPRLRPCIEWARFQSCRQWLEPSTSA